MTRTARFPRSTSRRAVATSASAGASGAPASQLLIGGDLPRTAPRPRRRKAPVRIRLDDAAATALAAGSLRLLAIDQGSNELGLAYFVGDRPQWTRLLAPSGSWSWQRRMRWTTDQLRELLARHDERPHVIAIEEVVFHRSVSAAVTMGKTVGWLMCVLEHWYPGIRLVGVNPASVRGAAEAGATREKAKERFMRVATFVLGGAPASQDEADAVCIAIAATARLRRDAQLTAAGA